MTRHSTITSSDAESNSAKTLTAADLIRMAAEVDAKFTAVLFHIKNRIQSRQDYLIQVDLLKTAFELCHTFPEKLDLLNSWLKEGAK